VELVSEWATAFSGRGRPAGLRRFPRHFVVSAEQQNDRPAERDAEHPDRQPFAGAGIEARRGSFGAGMAVEFVNDGPVTIVLD
jgi:hypothetical protein